MNIFRYAVLAFVALFVVLAIVNRQKAQQMWQSTKRFFREVKVEMQKVSWPSRNDLIGSTIAVLTVVVVLTLIVTAADQILNWVMDLLLPGKGA